MFRYRPGEGVYARGTAFWSLGGFAFLAGHRFFLWSQRFDFTATKWIEEIPVAGVAGTVGLFLSIAVVLGLFYSAWRVVNVPRLADLLVDTELEMKKVTWPSFDETRASSFVVILCVLIMVGFLAVADVGLEKLFFTVVYGGAGHGG